MVLAQELMGFAALSPSYVFSFVLSP